MKKLLSIFLLLTLSFAFSACGDSDDEPEKFVWGGDWNNPSDPNYKAEYNSKYNPIQGLWRRDNYKNLGFYFSEDFKMHEVQFYSDVSYKIDEWGSKYVINDKAFSVRPPNSYILKYNIDGNKLSFAYEDHEDDRTFCTRVQE